MLESLLHCPPIVGMEISWFQRLRCVIVTLLNITFDYACIGLFRDICFRKLGLSTGFIFSVTLGFIFFVTLALYVYTVYLIDLLYRPRGVDGKDEKKD